MDSMHITTLTRAIFTLVLITLSGELLAQTVMEQLKSLSEQHQYGAMYELASQNREQYEGDPDFDFYYGVAAVDTNHVNEGVFALERVVFTQPKNHLARLELARGYYLQGDDVRSRQEFEKVLKVKPPASVVKVVDKYMAAIRIRESQYKISSSGYFDIEIGSDSNVNAGPEHNTLGIFENILSADNFEKSDIYTTLSFGGKLNEPVTPHSTNFINLDANIRGNSTENVNNNGQITVKGGSQWQKKSDKYRFSVLGQLYVLDGMPNRAMVGVGFEKIYAPSTSQQVTLSTNYVEMQYPDSAIYDSSQITLSLNSFSKGKNLSWYGGIDLGLQSPKEKDSEIAKSGADRTMLGGSIGALIPINNKSNLNLNLIASFSNYTGVYFGSTDKRKDAFGKLTFTYNHLINNQWKYRIGANYSLNDSNVALLTYNRLQLLAGFQKAF
jgi:hypothetical protein